MDRAKQLVNKAEIDLIAAKNLLQHSDSYPESIAFHLQQAMEKSLKALLAFCNSEIPRTHDLDYLIDLSAERYPMLTRYYDLSERLIPHAVLSRYEEGSDLEFDEATIMYSEVFEMVGNSRRSFQLVPFRLHLMGIFVWDSSA